MTKKKKAKRTYKQNFHLYVIRLTEAVLSESRFKRNNPGYEGRKACVYVGMTANPVQYRYEQHKSGKKANRYAQLYGEGVIEELCKSLENMTREAAEKREQKLAINLRNKGYAVWQG